MKRLLILMLFIAALSAGVSAQRGLAVARYFSKEVASNPKVTAVTISGSKLEKSRLDLYRSVTVAGDQELVAGMEKAVRSDGAKARDKEVVYGKGKLRLGFYTLAPASGRNRYLIFLNNSGGKKVTLIYMEGAASTADIRKMIF